MVCTQHIKCAEGGCTEKVVAGLGLAPGSMAAPIRQWSTFRLQTGVQGPFIRLAHIDKGAFI